jgi:hypothetical protein
MANTISREYANMLRSFHDSEPNFGVGFRSEIVAQLVHILGIHSICDYGAGKQELKRVLSHEFAVNLLYYPYDPAFPEFGEAKSADLVCCIEVLEHIEPDFLVSVLEDLKRVTKKFGFFTVNCAPASKLLPDGRNSHLIQQPISWWLLQLSNHFEIQYLNKTGKTSFAVLVTPLGEIRSVDAPIDITQSRSLLGHVRLCVSRIRTEVARRFRKRIGD